MVILKHLMNNLFIGAGKYIYLKKMEITSISLLNISQSRLITKGLRDTFVSLRKTITRYEGKEPISRYQAL